MEPSPDDPGYSQPQTAPQYAPVSVSKFVIMCLVTFGLYTIPWFYRCWRYTRDRDGSDIWPSMRALFNPLTYYMLLKDLRENTRYEIAGLFALLYFVMEALWRLPDPYWLLSTLAFVALLPAVQAINDLNRDATSRPAHASWRLRNIPIVLLGGFLLFFSAGSSLGVFPSTRVVQGSEMKASDLAFLVETGLISPDEEVLYFYSLGLFSIESDGQLLTDQRVISYWQDPITYEPVAASALFSEIADVETNWGAGLTDTLVRITVSDGTEFFLVLSTEAGGDREFIDALDQLRGAADAAAGARSLITE